MTNLEKLTSGDIAVRNNGTLEQFQEVYAHCFPESYGVPYGNWEFFEKDKGRVKHTDLPTIDITQLWEELQLLKKPEIWWIRVTGENVETLEKWVGSEVKFGCEVCGRYRREFDNQIFSGYTYLNHIKSDSLDFGNEIDFATFLKYTGVEPEKVEPIKGSTFEDTISELTQLINKRVDLRIKSDRLNDELTEINNQLSALLK